MSAVRLVLSLVAAALLVAPSALAASANGELEAATASFPEGAALTSVGLDALSEAAEVPTLTLDADDVAVHRFGSSTVQVGSLYSLERSAIDDSQTYGHASISLSQGAGDQIAALRTSGPATAQLLEADMVGIAGALLATAEGGSTCSSTEIVAGVSYCLDVRGVYEVAGSGVAQLAGDITILLYGPTLELQTPDGPASFASGVRPGENGVGQEDAWVVLVAKNVQGTLEGGALKLYSAAPTVTAARAALADAAGVVRVGAREYRASSDDMIATGALVLAPAAVPPTSDNGYGTTGPEYADSFTTRISGDVASINLNAAPAFLDSPAERGILAAIVGLAVAGIAYAWNHITFFAAALYTRLNKPDILDNDVRNRIYDIIRENPGISAREVHRRSEQSWGTVVYHLRQLERHHLVVSRSLGRTRNYYENHGKYRGMEVQLACLQSDRARVLARAIATQPGITQEQLAAASGYPQPTTSYYVRKLKQAGLVEEQREGRYAKYVPHADLPRFIAMSEHAPTTSATAPSGVQA